MPGSRLPGQVAGNLNTENVRKRKLTTSNIYDDSNFKDKGSGKHKKPEKPSTAKKKPPGEKQKETQQQRDASSVKTLASQSLYAFKCVYCERRFQRIFAFNQHVSKCPAKKDDKVDSTTSSDRTISTDESVKKTKKVEAKEPTAVNKAHKVKTGTTKKKTSGGPKNHKCPKCEKCFTLKNDLKRHQDSVHLNLRPFKCEHCSKCFTQAYNLRRHVSRVHQKLRPHVCKYCPVAFATTPDLKRHVDTVHLNLRPFECEKCQQGFGLASDLKRHVDTVHLNLRPFECVYCHHDFTKAGDLNRHVNNVHLKQRRFVCVHEQCQQAFAEASDLRIHVDRVHSDCRRFECVYCRHAFKAQPDLRNHLETVHKNVRPFQCDECPIAMKSKRSLRTHKHKKHGGKSYYCVDCNRKYKYKGDYNKHRKKHQGEVIGKQHEDILECRFCKPHKRLPNSASLTFHRILHHKDTLATAENVDIKDIRTNKNNKIFFENKTEMDHFLKALDEKSNKCDACGYLFFGGDAHLIHLEKYHNSKILKFNQMRKTLQEIFMSCKEKSSEDFREDFIKMHSMSRELVLFYDERRKLYILVFVPDWVREADLPRYLSDPKNIFFIYVGSSSVGTKGVFISSHHFSGQDKISTKHLSSILKNFKCYHINDIWVKKEEGLTGLESLKKAEALVMLKLHAFCVQFKREHFFQKLELPELKKNWKEEYGGLIQDEIRKSNGDIQNIMEFRVNFSKEVVINPDVITKEDISYSECTKCPDVKPLPSKHHALCHEVKIHGKKNLTDHEKILTAQTLDEVFHYLKQLPDEKSYFVYSVGGTEHTIKPPERIITHIIETTNTKLYLGLSASGLLSAYHFESDTASTLKKMVEDGLNLIHICSWEFEQASEMQKCEMTFILIEFIRTYQTGSLERRFQLANSFFQLFDIAVKFDLDEWIEIYDFSQIPACFVTQNHLLSFLKITSRHDVFEDITANCH